ncbi:uncharacterized transposon-derived protein F54H12.3 [Trichonephila clavipes]|nr:uncharacterized transposon-derived protein F54H12.3 [Trichonephila clavipes]
MEKLDRLKKLYFNPKEPSSFGGMKRLSKASGVHLNDVQKWLSQTSTFIQSFHPSQGFEPTKLTTDDEPELYKRLYHSNVDPQFSFTAGDIVRLSKAHKTFRKGYLPGWTEETFHIYKRERDPTIPPTYTLQDFNSKEIEGRFYNEELQKIDKSTNDYWAIEKIIRTKGKGASRQLFVKWVGFPDSQNSWTRTD